MMASKYLSGENRILGYYLGDEEPKENLMIIERFGTDKLSVYANTGMFDKNADPHQVISIKSLKNKERDIIIADNHLFFDSTYNLNMLLISLAEKRDANIINPYHENGYFDPHEIFQAHTSRYQKHLLAISDSGKKNIRN